MRTKNKLIVLILLALTLFTANSFAFDRSWSGEYQISFPAFGHADFVSEPSFRGWAFQFNEEVTDLLYLGAYFGWSTFYEDLGRETYSAPGHDETVHIWRRTNLFPVLFQPTIMILPDSPIRPIASLGIGVYFTHKQELKGFWDVSNSGVNFGLRPELGAQLELDRVGFKVSGAYNGVFGSSQVKDISSWTINMGIVLGM